jgi:hypothetical protein
MVVTRSGKRGVSPQTSSQSGNFNPLCRLHGIRLDKIEERQDILIDLVLNVSKGMKEGPSKMKDAKVILKKHKNLRPTVSIPTPYNGPIEINIESKSGKILVALGIVLFLVYVAFRIFG